MQGFPHSVYGTVTCQGFGVTGAYVQVITDTGTWASTTGESGIYGGTVLISGPDDTITVIASYPLYETTEASSIPSGSATMINVYMQPVPLSELTIQDYIDSMSFYSMFQPSFIGQLINGIQNSMANGLAD